MAEGVPRRPHGEGFGVRHRLTAEATEERKDPTAPGVLHVGGMASSTIGMSMFLWKVTRLKVLA